MSEPPLSNLPNPVSIGLNAAIIAVRALTPVILEVPLPQQRGQRISEPNVPPCGGLPFGPFNPQHHRTLEAGLRGWVEQQTGLHLGYVEQLYTFGDRGRRVEEDRATSLEVSIGYLALTRLPEQQSKDPSEERADQLQAVGGRWRSWYDYFPWEDWRQDRPAMLDAKVLPALAAWAEQAPDDRQRGLSPDERLRLSFGLDGAAWDEERVLERYELLYEAGLVLEHYRDQGKEPEEGGQTLFGLPMRMDHRRILATAISRLRGKLKYRPVVFELMGNHFTLTELQSTVEAISGRHLHKQNFRRLVEGAHLVEPTGAASTTTGGRPAKLYRFRRSVLAERPAPGLRLGGAS